MFSLFSLPFGRATNYWQNHQGVVVRLPAEAKLFPSPKLPGQNWSGGGATIHLLNGNRRLFRRD